MEGQAWYEYVRWAYYNPTAAMQELSSQDRGSFTVTPNRKVNATSWTINDVESTQRTYPVNASNFVIPIPATELSRAPNLNKTPVAYKFE